MLPSAFYRLSPSNNFVGKHIKNSYITDSQYSKALFDEEEY